MRPTKEEYYMAISQLASLRSTCLSRKVGAVIVKDDNPISFGFNGPARGVEHLELCPASHAEQNAIAFAARHGISTVGATIYVNTFPCKDCMNSIINSGITKVVYNSEYDANLSKSIASNANIEIIKYEGRDLETLLYDFGYIEKGKSR